jgi:hypothetical protein
MSKLEAGKLLGQFQPVRLDRLTADMAALFKSMAEKKGVKLQLEVENKHDATPPTYIDIRTCLPLVAITVIQTDHRLLELWEKIFCNL